MFEQLKSTIFKHINLSDDDLEVLTTAVYVKVYKRRSDLLRAGERWNKLFFIEQGLVRMFYLDKGGKEFNKAFFAEGQTIWPVAPMDREQGVLFNISAIEETAVLQIPFPILYKTLQKASLWEKFALPFAEKLVEIKFRREHDFLLLSALERLNQITKEAPHIVSRLPDYHLASYLGITNVSLSRIKRLTYDNESATYMS